MIENKFSEAFNISKLFKKNFSDNLFIEVSRHGLVEENKTEPSFIKISSDLDVPIVATNNIYFSDQSIYEAHDCLMCISPLNEIVTAQVALISLFVAYGSIFDCFMAITILA